MGRFNYPKEEIDESKTMEISLKYKGKDYKILQKFSKQIIKIWKSKNKLNQNLKEHAELGFKKCLKDTFV